MTVTAHQTWSPEQYAQQARFVSDLGMPVVELLAPRAGERILDLGCGDGSLTKKLVEMGCQVVGVDASHAMVAAAQALGLDARVMDGQSLPFAQEFDAVFSNAALHWMPRADVVIAGVWQSLKPGGRFVGECGGSGNTATVVHALAHALHRRVSGGSGGIMPLHVVRCLWPLDCRLCAPALCCHAARGDNLTSPA
jgi:trans-aconitate methyltransferase